MNPDWQDAWSYANPSMGYTFDNSWNNAQRARHSPYYGAYVPPQDSKCRITTQVPRDGYIDGGVILKEGLIITHNEFINLDAFTWKQFEEWADTMVNLAVDELLERKVLWVYNTVPSITSMAA